MTRIRSRDLIARAQSNADRSTAIAFKVGPALERVLDWLPTTVNNGISPATSGGDHSSLDWKVIDKKANEHDKKITALKKKTDRHAAYVQAIAHDLAEIDKLTTRLEATLRRLDVLDLEEAKKLANEADTSKSKQCVNPSCRAWISGIGDDRARDGRCDACRTWRDRRKRRKSELIAAGRYAEAGEIDILADRPHRLVHRIPLQGCADCERVHREVVA